MTHVRKVFGALLILGLASLVFWLPSDLGAGKSSQRAAGSAPSRLDAVQQDADGTEVSEPVEPGLTQPLESLPLATTEFVLDREVNPRMSYNTPVDPKLNPPGGPDPLLELQEGAPPAAPDAFGTPILNFNGQGFTFVNPPDTEGDVGPNHYVQMINHGSGSVLTVYNKSTGAVTAGPIILSSLATSGACRTGAGDPIVLYDPLANRWLLSEFADTGNHLCVYISTTANPTGTYYFYDFTTPNFPDYPKYAVWPNAYYVTTNEESGPAVYALDRVKMLAGQAATFQRRSASALSGFGFQTFTPADLDGSAAPAAAPGLFMRHRDTEVHGPPGYPNKDLLEVWQFDVNWTTPANSTFTKLVDIQVAEFDSDLCGLTSFSCIQQPNTSVRLDPLREPIMWRLSYRNFGSYQALVGNFTTDVDGNDRAGVRWFELRRTTGAWSLYQEGTYAPNTSGSPSRWMGAIAMDRFGNIALAYNASSSSVYPGLRYAGRLASDPVGSLPQGEYTIVNGTGSNGSFRYGDYAAMSVDPSDDCTFWFTGMYNASSQWSTRIAKFKFDQCSAPAAQRKMYVPLVVKTQGGRGTIAGRVVNAVNATAISGAQVCVLSTNQCATTNAQGNYSIANVPAGSQNVRASASGFTSLQQSVTVLANQSVTLNFALSPNLGQGEIRIVLTWAATPRDLDSHLWLPASNPYHVFWANKGNCNAAPYACLDVDDVTGYGPETITIRQRYPGTYVYAVYNYSDESPITASSAQVQVYDDSGLRAEYHVPTSGSGRWWYVFDMNGASGQLTPHNVVQVASPAPYLLESDAAAKP